MNQATLNFVRQHADDDVRLLALRGSKDSDVCLTLALQQIQGRQSARKKIPSWAAIEDILYPPHLNMEQCSSEASARYKGALCSRLIAGHDDTSLVDLTGGMGVDFAFMRQPFSSGTYVEQDSSLFALARHNFDVLHIPAVCVNADGTDFLERADHATLIFLDPARRDSNGGRTYAIDQCTPNVLALKERLLDKSDFVLLKLSPMLDWRLAVAQLGHEHVSEVHIVAVDGECKELLVLLSHDGGEVELFCANDGYVFHASEADVVSCGPLAPLSPQAYMYLYEPHPALMKAGCFHLIAQRFGVSPIAQNSHLFVAQNYVDEFPGRRFVIDGVFGLNKRLLRKALSGVEKANIAVRNFPMSVAELRRRLKLKDGGSTYLFATTQADNSHCIMLCRQMA